MNMLWNAQETCELVRKMNFNELLVLAQILKRNTLKEGALIKVDIKDLIYCSFLNLFRQVNQL